MYWLMYWIMARGARSRC